jgi:hypothetical protein
MSIMEVLPRKTIHMAHMVSENGEVSALCYAKLRPIDLKTSTWTNRPEAVTCTQCKRAIKTARVKK